MSSRFVGVGLPTVVLTLFVEGRIGTEDGARELDLVVADPHHNYLTISPVFYSQNLELM